MGKIAEIIKLNVDCVNEAGQEAIMEGFKLIGIEDAEREIERLIKHEVKKELKKKT